jgi:predicted DNA binding CopG/RHH family protein
MVKTTMRLPERIWKAVRIRAIEEGRDAQDLVAEAITAYLSVPRKRGVR